MSGFLSAGDCTSLAWPFTRRPGTLWRGVKEPVIARALASNTLSEQTILASSQVPATVKQGMQKLLQLKGEVGFYAIYLLSQGQQRPSAVRFIRASAGPEAFPQLICPALPPLLLAPRSIPSPH
ncbi:MAG TPA: hypothetical protein DEF05_13350 [Erwinia sp.]|nr:hypothetical protein [Erwinia sp.]